MYLDNQIAAMNFSLNGTVGNVKPGLHVLRVEFVASDHLPFDPPEDENARSKVRNTLRELGRRPQVYAKVSGVLRRIDGRVPLESTFYRQSLDQLWDTFGVDHLVYGSNWPVSNLLAPYDAVLHVVCEYFLAKGVEPTEKYFWKNSLAAYKWLDNS